MDVLPKDIKIQIALELSPPDLLKFCLSKKNNNICNSQHLWRRKLERDFQVVSLSPDPRAEYSRIITEIQRIADSYMRAEHGSFAKYLTDEYKQDLYNGIVKMYLKLTSDARRGLDVTDKDQSKMGAEEYDGIYNYNELFYYFGLKTIPLPDNYEDQGRYSDLIVEVYDLANIKYVGYE